jgi:hypothetical protein
LQDIPITITCVCHLISHFYTKEKVQRFYGTRTTVIFKFTLHITYLC